MIWRSLLSANTGGWDISTAVFNQEFSITTGPTVSEGIFFKPDGTRMFIADANEVYQYDLGTNWSVSTASSAGTFSLSSQTSDAEALHFSPDGTIMYVAADTEYVYQYSLSTAWDVTSGSFSTSLSIGGNISTGLESCFVRQDGLKLYLVRIEPGEPSVLKQYNLSTAFAVSSATLVNDNTLPIDSNDFGGIFFKPDGKKLFTSKWGSPGAVEEYDIGTAWDTGTITFSQSFSLATEREPEDVFFRQDGKKMYVLGDDENKVTEYDLS
jgi:WD40 repeat protein